MKRMIFGRTGKSLVLVLMLLMSSQLMANYKFYNMIRHVCKVYQVEVTFDDMRLHQEFDSKVYLDMKLKAGRNDFDTVLMVGFIAAGKALETVPELELAGVNVTLRIAARESSVIIASANADDIVRMIRGDITSLEFKNKYLTII